MQILLYMAVIFAVTKPLGNYMYRVFEGDRQPLPRLFGAIERLLYRLCGVDPQQQQDWKQYTVAMLVFSALKSGLISVYGLNLDGPHGSYVAWAVGFLCGFSERLAQDFVGDACVNTDARHLAVRKRRLEHVTEPGRRRADEHDLLAFDTDAPVADTLRGYDPTASNQ
jgi:hypothetical protein